MSDKYAFWVTLRPQSDCCRQDEAEVCILDLKTIWSEFQKASQTATKRGNAELRKFNFKTTYRKSLKETRGSYYFFETLGRVSFNGGSY